MGVSISITCDHCGNKLVGGSVDAHGLCFCDGECLDFYDGKLALISHKYVYEPLKNTRADVSFRYITKSDIKTLTSNFTLVLYIGDGEWSFNGFQSLEQLNDYFSIHSDSRTTDDGYPYRVFDNVNQTTVSSRIVKTISLEWI